MLVETSRSVHWYVELSAKSETAPLISRVVPYLDAFTDQQSLRFGGIEEMVDQTARQAVMKTDPLPREHARAYLDLVRVTLRKDKSVGAGGLLLVMDAQGGMHFAQVQDLLELNLPGRLWVEKTLSGPDRQHLGLSIKHEKAGPTLERKREHEMSFRM